MGFVSAVTDSRTGAFHARATTADHAATLSSPGYVDATLALDRERHDAALELGTIRLEPAAHVTIQTLDADRTPIAARIFCVPITVNAREAPPICIGSTDDTGVLTTGMVPRAHLFAVTEEKRSSSVYWGSEKGEMGPILLTLEGTAIERLGVRDEQERPLPGIALTVLRLGVAPRERLSLTTNDQGLSPVPLCAGEYVVESLDSSFLLSDGEHARTGVTDRSRINALEIVLGAGSGTHWIRAALRSPFAVRLVDSDSGRELTEVEGWLESYEPSFNGWTGIGGPEELPHTARGSSLAKFDLSNPRDVPELALALTSSGFAIARVVSPAKSVADAGGTLTVATRKGIERRLMLRASDGGPYVDSVAVVENRTQFFRGAQDWRGGSTSLGEVGPFHWRGGDVSVTTPSRVMLALVPSNALNASEVVMVEIAPLGRVDVRLPSGIDLDVACRSDSATLVEGTKEFDPRSGKRLVRFEGLVAGRYELAPRDVLAEVRRGTKNESIVTVDLADGEKREIDAPDAWQAPGRIEGHVTFSGLSNRDIAMVPVFSAKRFYVQRSGALSGWPVAADGSFAIGALSTRPLAVVAYVLDVEGFDIPAATCPIGGACSIECMPLVIESAIGAITESTSGKLEFEIPGGGPVGGALPIELQGGGRTATIERVPKSAVRLNVSRHGSNEALPVTSGDHQELLVRIGASTGK